MRADYQVHKLKWNGIAIEIRYTPSWAAYYERIYGEPLAHLEIESLDPKRRPLPMTGTGYRSYFTSPSEIDAQGGPVAYVQAWLDHEAASDNWRNQETTRAQLSLFD
jgi:hypothetical protein